MNIFDLFETPGMGHPRDTKGVQSAADQSAASVIGSGTTKREDKKKPVTMMGKSVKEDIELAEGTPVNMNALMARGDRATGPWWARAGDLNYMGSTESNKILQYKLYFPDMFSSRALTMFDDNKDKLLKAAREHHMEQDDNGEWFYPVYRKTEATKHEISALKYMFGEKIIKKAADEVEEAAVKPNFKMPPESLQDKMYRQHQELRKQRGAPSPEEYKQRIAQKQAEIDALKEGILDRAAPKLPKPRNPADQILQTKVNAGGRHLDKKRRQELAPKHKHKDLLAESLRPGEYHTWTVHFADGTSQQVNVPSDEFDVRAYFAKRDKQVVKVDKNYAIQGQQQDQARPDNYDDRADRATKAHIQHDRGLTEQEIEEEFRLGKKLGTRRDRFKSLRKRKEGILGEFDSGEEGFGPFKVYLEGHLVDKFATFDEAKEEIEFLKDADPRTANGSWKIEDGTGETVWEHDPGEMYDQMRRSKKIQVLPDRKMNESQATKITDYDLWLDEVKELGAEIYPQKDRNVYVAQSWDGDVIGKFHLGKGYGFINHSSELDETIRKINNQYRLLSKKGKNLGTFDTKAGAEKHEREVQYFKHKGMSEGSTDDSRFQKMMGNIQKSTPTLVLGYIALEFASERKSKKIKGVTRNGKPIPDVINDPEEELSGKIEFTPDQIEQQLMSIGRKYGWDSIEPGQGRGYTEMFFETSREYTSDDQNLLAANIVKTVNAINKFFNGMNSSLQATGLPGYTTSVWQGMGPPDDINEITDLSQMAKIAKSTGAKSQAKNTRTSDDVGVELGNAILAHYKEFGPDGGYSSSQLNQAAKIAKIYITQGERAGLQAQMKAGVVGEMIDELISDAGLSGIRTIWELDETQGVDEGWKGKVAGAALAGAAALGGGAADAQNIDLPGPQVSYIAHVIADVNGREVNKTVNLGSQYQSKEQVEQDLEEYMQSKGITRYSIRVEQSYDQPGGYGQRRSGGSYATGGDYATAPIYAPGLGDMIAGRVSREIRAGIPDRGGYATGGSTKGQRPRDGSQWWRDQLPPMMREEALEEDIERHLLQMRRAGYDIVQEEWSDKYKDSINCSNPKGFSQKAHCAGKKKNEDVSEEKVRLDPKCWKGKKIGNPKTKMKGGVRVNNCVPK